MASATSTYHHGNLRHALIEAGTQLLIARGINGLSLRETAKMAGVSHTAPYRHFRDKEALLAAIAESGFDNLAQSIDKAINEYPADPREQLVTACVAYMKLAITHLEMHQLLFGSTLNEETITDTLPDKKQQAFNQLKTIINNGQKKKIFRKNADSQQLTISAWSLIHGYTMLLTSGYLKETATSLMQIEMLAREVCNNLVDGIGTQPPAGKK